MWRRGRRAAKKNCAKTSREARVELFDAAFQVNVSNVSATEYNAKKTNFLLLIGRRLREFS